MDSTDLNRPDAEGPPLEPSPPGPCPATARLLNLIVDLICTQIAMYILGTFIGLVVGALRRGTGIWLDARAIAFLAGLAGLFAYYFLFEYHMGKTPGKLLTRTRVVAKNGETPGRRAILVRTAARFIPFEWVSFFGKNPIGWHDSLSETMVVQDQVIAGGGHASRRGGEQ